MKLKFLLFAVFLAAAPYEVSLLAQSPPTSDATKIAFVHLRFTGETVQLVACKIVPGNLKPIGKLPGKGIALRVTDTTGALRWEGRIPDPHTRVVEAADDLGRLSSQLVRIDPAELTVRIPFFEAGQTLHIRRLPAEAGANSSELASFKLPMP